MLCLERDNISTNLQPVEIPVEEWLNFNLRPRPYRAVEVEESFNPVEAREPVSKHCLIPGDFCSPEEWRGPLAPLIDRLIAETRWHPAD